MEIRGINGGNIGIPKGLRAIVGCRVVGPNLKRWRTERVSNEMLLSEVSLAHTSAIVGLANVCSSSSKASSAFSGLYPPPREIVPILGLAFGCGFLIELVSWVYPSGGFTKFTISYLNRINYRIWYTRIRHISKTCK